MGFSPSQIRKLKARLREEHVRYREVNGQKFRYLEGWHVVAEANRIFGFDGWDRETLELKCLWAKQLKDGFSVNYLARVRVTVQAGERQVFRDGTGFGEAASAYPGQAHEIAAKAAETDATKRALVTFGIPFGLSLYTAAPARQAAGNKTKSRQAGLFESSAEEKAAMDSGPGASPESERLLPARWMDDIALLPSEPKSSEPLDPSHDDETLSNGQALSPSRFNPGSPSIESSVLFESSKNLPP